MWVIFALSRIHPISIEIPVAHLAWYSPPVNRPFWSHITRAHGIGAGVIICRRSEGELNQLSRCLGVRQITKPYLFPQFLYMCASTQRSVPARKPHHYHVQTQTFFHPTPTEKTLPSSRNTVTRSSTSGVCSTSYGHFVSPNIPFFINDTISTTMDNIPYELWYELALCPFRSLVLLSRQPSTLLARLFLLPYTSVDSLKPLPSSQGRFKYATTAFNSNAPVTIWNVSLHNTWMPPPSVNAAPHWLMFTSAPFMTAPCSRILPSRYSPSHGLPGRLKHGHFAIGSGTHHRLHSYGRDVVLRRMWRVQPRRRWGCCSLWRTAMGDRCQWRASVDPQFREYKNRRSVLIWISQFSGRDV